MNADPRAFTLLRCIVPLHPEDYLKYKLLWQMQSCNLDNTAASRGARNILHFAQHKCDRRQL